MVIQSLFVGVVVSTLPAADENKPDDTVVLRAADGRFLNGKGSSHVRARAPCPGEDEQFGLFELSDGTIALRAPSGRFLTVDGHPWRLRVGRTEDAPGPTESFRVVPVQGNCVGLETFAGGRLVAMDGGPARRRASLSGYPPPPSQTMTIYRFDEAPQVVRTALSVALQGVLLGKLAEKEYSKVRTDETDRYVTLPAPTLRDPGRRKRHKVIGMEKETHVRARLVGRPEIRITEMPLLTGYRDRTSTLMMFTIEARLPVQGHVRYRVPDLLSASTGFQAVVRLTVVGEVPIRSVDDQLSIDTPELRRIDIRLHGLDLSNDVLQTARHAIERAVNEEVHKNSARIRAEANEELREAVSGQDFQHPLLSFLVVP